MRVKVPICDTWFFCREDVGAERAPQACQTPVELPHTWNAQDGQDGGNDYYRGRCWYARQMKRPALEPDGQAWLEFSGVAMTAEVYMNGQKLACHEGGYSTFRVDITDALEEENWLVVSVDNGKNDRVYPQKADFTFYGGIYRDVSLITVPKAHFALDQSGGPGLAATPRLDGSRAEVTLEAWTSNADGQTVCFSIPGVGEALAVVQNGYASAVINIENVHLWDGLADPYLYIAKAVLPGDEVSIHFGCRSFRFDPEQGFFLNGRPYRLCGAARHQDREGVGNALTKEMHEEDMALMREMGCNTIRLAHYQHDQYFYDLCDQYGMIVWAEIPYITEHLANGNENTRSQMRELIIQNKHHPSIVCWGLSNEITTTGGPSEAITENHRALNDLCHQLDPTRPTTMAHMFLLDPDDPLVMLPDLRSYNLYYGWYVGDLEQNDQWFDEFHRKHPNAVIGLSEYGADANPEYQSAQPEKGDWSEGYQALYHEHMMEMWAKRPYIWAMHVWNMFDFGADGRDEGGKPGQNQKGLVTFDRKTKKDAFYLYKAYLSSQPFVHICGGRYVDRPEAETEVKVYSNQPSVTLYVDGRKFEEQTGDKIFLFRVPITGTHSIEARSEGCVSVILVRRVEAPNPAYQKPGTEAVVNWFDHGEAVERAGYYSIHNTMAEINQSPEAMAALAVIQEKAMAVYGDVAKNVQVPESMRKMMERLTVEATLKQMGSAVTPEMVRELNQALNNIAWNG